MTITQIISYFLKGHERSVKIKKNIVGNILVKVSSTVLSLVLIPMTITYVNPTRYGIWLTLSSVISPIPNPQQLLHLVIEQMVRSSRYRFGMSDPTCWSGMLPHGVEEPGRAMQ